MKYFFYYSNMSYLSGKLINTINLLYKFTHNPKHKYHVIRLLSYKEIGHLKSSSNQDILLYNLNNATTTNNLLQIIAAHHKIMNNKHIIQAFKSLFYLQKNEKFSSMDITSNPTFKYLCLSLKTQMRSIEINDLTETLKILSYVGVHSNTTIIQMILQMIRQSVNSLSLQQIIFLDFLLKQFKSTPLSDALLIAFPIIFETHLPLKMNPNNLSHLSDYLQYATKNNLSESTTDLILNTIALNKDNNTKAINSIVWSICDLKQNENFEPLLKKYLNHIVKHADELNISELETILTKLTFRYNKKHSYYFNKEFFDLVAHRVIENNLGFQQAVWILQKFSKVGYSNNDLLDYLATLTHNNRNLISQSDSANLLSLVVAFANTEYRPFHWETVKQAILENENYFDDKRKIEWIKFAGRLAVLDIFIPKLLEKSLDKDYLHKRLGYDTGATLEYFLILYQTISTLRPEYSNMLPDSSYVQQAMKMLYPEEMYKDFRPFQPALERGFGGESYVLSNVATKLGHLLHHVVIMRKGGYPIAFNEQNHPLVLEDLQIPTDSHIIVIYCCDLSYYKLDSKVLKGIYSLMFRTIEACGYLVIPVSLEVWSNLPDYEKIPYLMQAIRMKNDEFEKLSIVQ